MSKRTRRYQQVSTSIWDDDRIRKLAGKNEDLRVMFLYLLTNKHSNLPGLYILPKNYIVDDLNWIDGSINLSNKHAQRCLSIAYARVEHCLSVLKQCLLIAYDDDTQTILMLNHLKHRPLDNPNKVLGAAQAINEIPKSPLFKQLLQIIEEMGLSKEYAILVQALRNRIPKDSKTLSQSESVSVSVSVLNNIPLPSNPCAMVTPPTSLPLPPSPPPKDPKPEDPFFSLFWKEYPIKKEKSRTFQELKKLKPSDELKNKILESLKEQKKYKEKCDKQKVFCPEFIYPHRWLKGKRWEDEIESGSQVNEKSEAEIKAEREKWLEETEEAANNLCKEESLT